MALKLEKNAVVAGKKRIPYKDFPLLHDCHLFNVPRTSELERIGHDLLTDNFLKWEDLQYFIRAVCIWGNYPGIGGRIIKNNPPQKIQAQFRKAGNYLREKSEPAHALAELNTLHSLGQTSFASKHLRFLRPDICPVLDSVLSHNLGYKLTPNDYQNFSEICFEIAGRLTLLNSKIWSVADVEMSLFAYFGRLEKGNLFNLSKSWNLNSFSNHCCSPRKNL